MPEGRTGTPEITLCRSSTAIQVATHTPISTKWLQTAAPVRRVPPITINSEPTSNEPPIGQQNAEVESNLGSN